MVLIYIALYCSYGWVPDTFAMDDVACLGSESHIRNCSHKTTDNCGERDGAGVVCATLGKETNILN